MEGLVTALKNVISADALFTSLTALVPLIGGVIIFAFVYGIIKRIVKGVQKGRASI